MHSIRALRQEPTLIKLLQIVRLSYYVLMHLFSFVHIYREANGVANRLARLASMSPRDSIPCISYDVLLEDGCFILRDFGSMSSLLLIML